MTTSLAAGIGQDLPISRDGAASPSSTLHDDANSTTKLAPPIALGSGWYHEAAIQAEQAARKNWHRHGDVGPACSCAVPICWLHSAHSIDVGRHAPKIDQPIRLVSASSAMRPRCELPLASRPGDHTAIEALPGAIARMPPPTPLLPGRPTR